MSGGGLDDEPSNVPREEEREGPGQAEGTVRSLCAQPAKPRGATILRLSVCLCVCVQENMLRANVLALLTLHLVLDLTKIETELKFVADLSKIATEFGFGADLSKILTEFGFVADLSTIWICC